MTAYRRHCHPRRRRQCGTCTFFSCSSCHTRRTTSRGATTHSSLIRSCARDTPRCARAAGARRVAPALHELARRRRGRQEAVGTFGSVFEFASATAKILGGVFVDTHNPRTLLAGALAVTGLANLAFAWTDAFYVWLALWATNGVAQAFGWPALTRIFMVEFANSNRRGVWYSLLALSQNIGSAATAVRGPAAAAAARARAHWDMHSPIAAAARTLTGICIPPLPPTCAVVVAGDAPPCDERAWLAGGPVAAGVHWHHRRRAAVPRVASVRAAARRAAQGRRRAASVARARARRCDALEGAVAARAWVPVRVCGARGYRRLDARAAR